MNLEDVKGLRAKRNALIHSRQKTALEVIDWLIAEVERLTVALDVQVFISRKFMAERDRYKAALEQIADLDCVCYGVGVGNKGCDCAACIAARAVQL